MSLIIKKNTTFKIPRTPPISFLGLALWLKADTGVTTTAEQFISQVVISGGGRSAMNGTYTRASGGETSFVKTGDSNFQIHWTGVEWYIDGDEYYCEPDESNRTEYAYNPSYDMSSNWLISVQYGCDGTPPTGSLTLSPTGNTLVTAWADQSNNGNNAIAYYNPLLVLNELNGKPVIDFDETQYFESNNQNLNNNSSIFFVVKSRGDHGMLVDTSDFQGVNFFLGADPNNSIAVGVANVAVIANDNGDNGNNWMIASTIRSNNLTSIIYKNGTQVANGNYDTSSLNPTDSLIIGTASDFNGYWYLNGQIAEIIIYNRVLTISERQQVEAYLNSKYQIY